MTMNNHLGSLVATNSINLESLLTVREVECGQQDGSGEECLTSIPRTLMVRERTPHTYSVSFEHPPQLSKDVTREKEME